MQLVEITEETQNAFFSCLHLEIPEDISLNDLRRDWYEKYKGKGYRAKVLMLDNGQFAGKCHYIPIEHSPLVGEDLMVILCIYVHSYKHYVGDQRGRGYGRYMLKSIEEDALASGYKGVAAWAMDWFWNPVSFYEQMDYIQVDKEDKVVVVWKPFENDAKPPELMRIPHHPAKNTEKVNILVADNGWCDGYQKLITVRKAIKGLENIIEYTEAGPPYGEHIIHLGKVGGVFLDGEAYRPYELIGSSEDLRDEIKRLYESKKISR